MNLLPKPWRCALRVCALTSLSTLMLLNALDVAASSPVKNCLPQKLNAEGNIKFDEFRGKVVYLDYWASWCGPCRKSFPFMNELHKEFSSDVVVIGISVDSEKSDAENFLKSQPADFLLGIDTVGTCPQEFKVNGMPSTYIFDRNGDLVFSHEGFRKNDPQKLRQKLGEIVGSKTR